VNQNRDWKRILPGLIISIIALALVLYFADLRQVASALRRANYWLILLVSLLTLAWLVVRAVVWRILLKDQATYGQVFLSLNEGYLINNILPLRLGEVARAYLLSKKAGLGFLEVFSTVIIERSLDLIIAAGLLLSALPFVVKVNWAFQAAIGAGFIVLAGLSMLYLIARNPGWTLLQFDKIAHRWPKLDQIGRNQLNTFLSGLSVLTVGKRFLTAVLWLIANWGIAIMQYYFLLLAFYPGPKFVWAIFTLGVVALGAAAPSSPGALGVLEASMVGALAVFGVDVSISLAIAITAHAINYVITGGIGMYALVQDGIHISRFGKLYQELKDITPTENAP
jgi:uncharacterized protein (TIRG00374 family)